MTLRLGIAALLGTALLLVAAAPRSEYRDSERKHWSLLERTQPHVPAFSAGTGEEWIRSPDSPQPLRDSVEAIDAFVLSRLNEEGLRPASPADRRTLIRRLYFDLIGLPPTPAEVADFLTDKSPGVYLKLVDRLLASPHYGERWAQHWLDVVRFAESEGFEYDSHLPGAWRFRDYVIQSFNNDKPYDQFIREQLAGDEIDPSRNEYKIAAGFHRLGAVRRNAGNQEVAGSRNEVLTGRTDIIGAAFLGLTVGCARCHDHMFDPIRQKDYYRLQGFLAATREHNLVLASEETQAAWKAKTEEIKKKVKELKEKAKKLSTEERKPVNAEAARLEATLPEPLPTICSIENVDEKRTQIHVLERGNWDNKGDAVNIRALGVLLPEGAGELPPDTKNPRTKLADWIAGPDHPLTARVMVNRIWQYHFGQGIVRTANDFGFNGDRPSHPELLDFLANEFVDSGWSVKHMHRLIVLSQSYRQSSRSAHEATGIKKDPENRLLWRFSRRRLQAEEIRDSMLAVAGKLNTRMRRQEHHCSGRGGFGQAALQTEPMEGGRGSQRTLPPLGLPDGQAQSARALHGGVRSADAANQLLPAASRAPTRRKRWNYSTETCRTNLRLLSRSGWNAKSGRTKCSKSNWAYLLAAGRGPTEQEAKAWSRVSRGTTAARVCSGDVQFEFVFVFELSGEI